MISSRSPGTTSGLELRKILHASHGCGVARATTSGCISRPLLDAGINSIRDCTEWTSPRDPDCMIPSGPLLDHRTLHNGSSLVTASVPDAALTCLDFRCRGGSAWEHQGEEGDRTLSGTHGAQGQPRAGPRNWTGESGSSWWQAAPQPQALTMCTSTCSSPPRKPAKPLVLLLDPVLVRTGPGLASPWSGDVVLEEIAQYSDQPDDQVLQDSTRALPCTPRLRPT